jgi:hypothetical protein
MTKKPRPPSVLDEPDVAAHVQANPPKPKRQTPYDRVKADLDAEKARHLAFREETAGTIRNLNQQLDDASAQLANARLLSRRAVEAANAMASVTWWRPRRQLARVQTALCEAITQFVNIPVRNPISGGYDIFQPFSSIHNTAPHSNQPQR